MLIILNYLIKVKWVFIILDNFYLISILVDSLLCKAHHV